MNETKWPYNFDVNLYFLVAHVSSGSLWVRQFGFSIYTSKKVWFWKNRPYVRPTVSSKTARLSYIHFQS